MQPEVQYRQEPFPQCQNQHYMRNCLLLSLLCDTSMTGVIIDRFGASVAMRPYDETHILARAQVAVSPQFFGWLAGLSTHIRVISPDSVVNEYQIFLQEILRSYTDMQ